MGHRRANKPISNEKPLVTSPVGTLAMVNCYIHAERQASRSCVICGRGICRECSNWAAGDIYVCPRCWQQNVPVQSAPQGQKRQVTGRPTGVGLSRALYYATALIIVVIGSWYVYATFISPIILFSGGVPPIASGSASSGLGGIWSRYKLLITISASMFLVVLVGGELMLRTGPKQARTVPTQPQLRPTSQSVSDSPRESQPIVRQHEVPFERPSPKQSQPIGAQPEVQPLTQTLRAVPGPSQQTVTQPEIQPRSQTRLVYCIYCGNKILSTTVICDRCGKQQE